MGGKSKSNPAPVTTTPQVQTPDVDVATVAAQKALAAQGDVRASQASEEEGTQKQTGAGLATASAMQGQKPKRPRPQRDPAAVAQSGSMNASAVLTG